MDGGPIHATSRQSTRPARSVALAAGVAAATPETAMFVPAAACGRGRQQEHDRQPDVPSTRPTSPTGEGDGEAPECAER